MREWKKRIISSLVLLITTLGVSTGIYYNEVYYKNIETDYVKTESLKDFSTSISNQLSGTVSIGKDFGTCSLIVSSKTRDFEDYGASRSIQYDNFYILEYKSPLRAKNAYKKLKNSNEIVSVDEDVLFEASTIDETSPSNDISLNIEGLSSSEMKKSNKETITVAVLDSGYDYSSDNPYKDNILYDEALNFSNEESLSDSTGHGSLISDIIMSTGDYNVNVLPIKIINDNGITSSSRVIAGIQYAIDNNVDIINISLTAYASKNSDIISEMISRAKDNGIFVVVSAGNFKSDTSKFSPANSEDAIVVSACRSTPIGYDLTDYSNYGETVDFTSCGTVNIDSYDNKYDSSFSGTSVSAALVSGMIADYKATFPTLSYDEILEDLQKVAFDVLDKGKDIYTGYGLLTNDFISTHEGEQQVEESEDLSLLDVDWKSMSDEEFNDKYRGTDITVCKIFVDKLSKEDLKILKSREIFFNGGYVYVSYDSNMVETHRIYYDKFVDFLNSDDYDIVVEQGDKTLNWSNKAEEQVSKVVLAADGLQNADGDDISSSVAFEAKCASNNGLVEFSAWEDGSRVTDYMDCRGLEISGVKYTAEAGTVGQWGVKGLAIKKGNHTHLKGDPTNASDTSWKSKSQSGNWTGGYTQVDDSWTGKKCGKEYIYPQFLLGADDIFSDTVRDKQVYTLHFQGKLKKYKDSGEVNYGAPVNCGDPYQITRTFYRGCTNVGDGDGLHKKSDCVKDNGDFYFFVKGPITASGYPKTTGTLPHLTLTSSAWKLVYANGGKDETNGGAEVDNGIAIWWCNRNGICQEEMDRQFFYRYCVYDELINSDNTTYISDQASLAKSSVGAWAEPNTPVSYTTEPTAKYNGVSSSGILAFPSIMRLENKLKEYNVKIVGTPNVFDQSKMNGVAGTTANYKVGTSVDLSTKIVNDGYVFDKFTYEVNDTGVPEAEKTLDIKGEEIDSDEEDTYVYSMIVPTANTTITAHAKPKSVEVTYHSNTKYGQEETITDTWVYGEDNTLRNGKEEFTEKGYQHWGWTEKEGGTRETVGQWGTRILEDGTEFDYFNGNDVTDALIVDIYDNEPDHKLDLYSAWENNSYKIDFDGNNHTGSTSNSSIINRDYDMPSQSLYYDIPENLNKNKFAKIANFTFDANGGTFTATGGTGNYKITEHFEFNGWTFQKDYGSLWFHDEDEVLNLTDKNRDTLVFKALWNDPGVKLPSVTKENAKFLGWYLQPQGYYGDYGTRHESSDKAELAGYAGQTYRVGASTPEYEFTLYAWWNENPTYTDIYEGTFYEGQEVSYSDLLKLIGVSDYEDDYRDSVNDLVLEYLEGNPSNETKTEAQKNKVEIDEDVLPPMIEDYSGDRSIRTRLNATYNPANLDVSITGVTYTKDLDGKSWFPTSGGASKEYTDDYDDVIAHGLTTTTGNIGYFYVDYKVTDEGVYNGATQILIDEGYPVSSPITINYRRKCVILYNNPPLLSIDDTVFMFTDERDTVDTEAKLKEKLRSYVHESDAQDSISFLPWWSSTRTADDLARNVQIATPTEVKDVSISSSWAKDHEARAEEIANFDKLSQICSLSDEEYGALTGYKVVYDTVDQFGKYASKRLIDDFPGFGSNPDASFSGTVWKDYQPEDDRTLQVVLINPELDTDLVDANTMKEVRYISYGYLGTLGKSYWKEYAYEKLENSFRSNATNPTSVQNGVFRNEDTNNEIPLQVNDYSK